MKIKNLITLFIPLISFIAEAQSDKPDVEAAIQKMQLKLMRQRIQVQAPLKVLFWHP